MYFMSEFLSDCLTPPCFLESVFCQELEKTGFRFVRDRESDEIPKSENLGSAGAGGGGAPPILLQPRVPVEPELVILKGTDEN